jgi:hypothetical protein
MKKIISLFKRNYEGDRLVCNEVVPGAEWVLAGEGIATIKHDGTSCMIRDGKLYKRHDAKKGKTPPPGFEPAQEPDEKTGHWPGWVPVKLENPSDIWHIQAFYRHAEDYDFLPWSDGTYELCGPKIQGNPENFSEHILIKHGSTRPTTSPPRDFEGLKEFLKKENKEHYCEGMVWHHPDGRMVKIKYKDFFKAKKDIR